MNAYLHCLSHTPLVGYVDPEQAVLDEVNGNIADARARIAAFDPELVVLFAPDHYNGFFYDVMPPFCLGIGATAIGDFSSASGVLPVPTALGVYGLQRVQQWGQDDQLSWLLIPLLGFTIAGCALCAIVYGLMAPEKWNARFNQTAAADAAPGRTNWFTVFAVALSLLVGTAVLMASIAFSLQRYYEYQIEEARKISQ